jgi:hypothetical protein
MQAKPQPIRLEELKAWKSRAPAASGGMKPALWKSNVGVCQLF